VPKLYKLLRRSDYAKSLRSVVGDYALPSFPGTTMLVLERIREADASIASVVGALSLDPGMSVRVLATANAAAFASRQRVDDLAQAVAMVGMSSVENLVMAMGVKEALPSPSCPGFDSRRFWLTAARRAATSQALAKLLHPDSSSACFTAALLQDMAVPLLAAFRTEEYGPVLEAWHGGEGDLADLEIDALGFHHAEVGMWLCAQWDLPLALGQAVGGHHDWAASEEVCLPALSLVARIRESEASDGVDALIALATKNFGLSSGQVSKLVDESFKAADELTHFFA
jgi:HD-like signal output (HDOD) protein